MRGIASIVRQIIFPPRCISCGELMPISVRQDKASVLCADCAPAWSRATLKQCNECYMPFMDCRCALPRLQKAGISAHVKLIPYDTEPTHAASRRVVLHIKNHRVQTSFSFLAAELAFGVTALVQDAQKARIDKGEKPLETVITYIPRARRTVRKLGFDQALELARSLSRVTGFPHTVLLRRVRDGSAQKQLSARERVESVKRSFAFSGECQGKRVLLVDDVVTTGSSMAAAATLLRNNGAAEVIAVSVAYTEPKKKL